MNPKKNIPLLAISLYLIQSHSYAFNWDDLWHTKDQKARSMMEKAQYSKALETFQRPDWRATAAYRAGEYEQSAKMFSSMKNADAFYNQGNALAHMGKYEQAIDAYNKALAMNADNQDALYNRELLKELLKKDKKSQESQKSSNQDQKQQAENKSGQGQNSQNQQKQNSQNQQKQDAQNQQKQDAQNQQKQDAQNQQKQDAGNQQKQDAGNQQNMEQNKQEQPKTAPDKAVEANQKQQPEKGKQKPENAKQNTDVSPASAGVPSKMAKEQQQEKEQLLRLIPDDPGGLLRQKFLRDHLRRQLGGENEEQ